MAKYYTYALFRLDGTPFYIGKGTGRRIDDHFRKSSLRYHSHKNNTIKSILKEQGYVNREILTYHEVESDAFEMERFLIDRYGLCSEGGLLTNVMKDTRDIPDSVRRLVVDRHSKSKLSDHEVISVHDEYMSGKKTLKECSEQLGISSSYMSQIFDGKRKPHLKLSSIGVGRSKHYSEEIIAEVVALKDRGLTFKDVSIRTGIPWSSVTHIYYRKKANTEN